FTDSCSDRIDRSAIPVAYVTGYSIVELVSMVRPPGPQSGPGSSPMQLISAPDAARLVSSNANVLVSGSGGGHGVPEAVLEAIEERFFSEKSPRDLTLIHVVGIGDRQEKGAARFGHEGLLRRSITSALVDSPILAELALHNKIESYILPQGVMSQL